MTDSPHPSPDQGIRLILASGSPRRHTLLESAGYRFEVVVAAVDETPLAGESPTDCAIRLAAAKARAGLAAATHDDSAAGAATVALGADTLIDLDGEGLGKPRDPDHAAGMLARLSGRTHRVVTAVAVAVAVAGRSRLLRATTETTVEFRSLTPAEIDWYVATGEPLDKAGAYGIHAAGGTLVRRIDGSYSSVVGLPLAETVELLADAGIGVAQRRRLGDTC